MVRALSIESLLSKQTRGLFRIQKTVGVGQNRSGDGQSKIKRENESTWKNLCVITEGMKSEIDFRERAV